MFLNRGNPQRDALVGGCPAEFSKTHKISTKLKAPHSPAKGSWKNGPDRIHLLKVNQNPNNTIAVQRVRILL